MADKKEVKKENKGFIKSWIGLCLIGAEIIIVALICFLVFKQIM